MLSTRVDHYVPWILHTIRKKPSLLIECCKRNTDAFPVQRRISDRELWVLFRHSNAGLGVGTSTSGAGLSVLARRQHLFHYL